MMRETTEPQGGATRESNARLGAKGVFLSQVRVRNFRNFKDTTASFTRGLNVIVGENNIGKTNLLDAIRAALGYASATGEVLRITAEDRHRDTNGSYSVDPIRIDLTFDGLTQDQQARFMEILEFNPEEPSASKASIHFEWSWDDSKGKWNSRRWGGGRDRAESSIPDDILQSISTTLLGALRDAQSSLAPGRSNRLGRLFRDQASLEQKQELEALFDETHKTMAKQPLLSSVQGGISTVLKGAMGASFAQDPTIVATEPEFDKIVNSLRLAILEGPQRNQLTELRSNGLGFNNLLYIATVLFELSATQNAELPLLLVEEPEAHLHPQLQTLLADHLGDGAGSVQTFVTTHSPNIAAHVPPDSLRILHRDSQGLPRFVSISELELTKAESSKLRRMLDVTKAALLFARGIILVEGITEGLLIPVIAKHLSPSVNLAQAGISVIPIAGVDFTTLAKLFGADKIQTRVSILTDGDPSKDVDEDGSPVPKKAASGDLEKCARLEKLLKEFKGNAQVSVFHSEVTLEYDLAASGGANAALLYDSWSECYRSGTPRNLKRAHLMALSSANEKALAIWRELCLKDPTHGKGEVAQALAEKLEELLAVENGPGTAHLTPDADSKEAPQSFVVPQYIDQAVRHVLATDGDA